jgi:hypothetical protein
MMIVLLVDPSIAAMLDSHIGGGHDIDNFSISNSFCRYWGHYILKQISFSWLDHTLNLGFNTGLSWNKLALHSFFPQLGVKKN